MIFKPLPIAHLNFLEIELTTECDLHCRHCDRRCCQAPSDEEMTIDQIGYFVDESKRLKYPWKRIHVLGGEPSLHPNLSYILGLLKTLGCELWVVTNGFGPKAKALRQVLPDGVLLRDTLKTGPEHPHFVQTDVTMMEQNPDEVLSCDHTDTCGLGLTRYGFYPCGPGASIDRVVRMDLGIRNLADVTMEVILKQMEVLCPLCGWSETRKGYPEPHTFEISPFWVKEYREYPRKAKDAPLLTYGGPG